MNIILGVTGSISAFRAVDIMRLFQKNDHEVAVILTRAAREFITPLTFETFAPGRVFYDPFKPDQDPLLHINLGAGADLLLVAPATADIIGKMAAGIADDLLTTLHLAFEGRVIVAPAMNTNMFKHPAVQHNLNTLTSRGVEVIPPDEGSLACKTKGKGRLPSARVVYDFCTGSMRV